MKIISKFLLSIILIVTSFGFSLNAEAAMDTWQKGASIQSNWSGDFGGSAFKESVDNLAATNADYVSLVFRLYQSNPYTTDIYAGGDTPTDEALIAAIDYVHSKGMKVMLKPHLETGTSEWRANINPSDRGAWFKNYGDWIVKYAQIGQAHGVEDFCIGSEMIKMSAATENGTNTQNWESLIGRVRSVYDGKLTYSANWGPAGFTDEKNNIQFWGSLDYIGNAAYYNLYGDNSVENLKNQWNNYNFSDIKPLTDKWGKPIVFTEIGYKSVPNSHTQPWDYWYGGPYDGASQANDYQALFDYWQNHENMQGVHLWDWSSNPNAGWPGDTSYTPQHKPAEETMREWFGSAGTPTPPGGESTFTTAAAANPAQVSIGQSTNVSVNVTANSGQAAGINIDVEIYNSSGKQIKQQIFSNQTFSLGQTQNYNVSFTPAANDTFKVKVGVFNHNWSRLFVWNDAAATFGSSGGSPGGGGGTPSPVSTIDIWWPTGGVTVPGVIVPFKALLTNRGVTDYDMFWQVDGGGLVRMRNDDADYPHKQFDTDLSGWRWRGSGPYRINFVAKDFSGKVLAEKSIDIFVAQ